MGVDHLLRRACGPIPSRQWYRGETAARPAQHRNVQRLTNIARMPLMLNLRAFADITNALIDAALQMLELPP